MKKLLLGILSILIFIIVLNQIIGQIQQVITKNEEEAIGTIKKKLVETKVARTPTHTQLNPCHQLICNIYIDILYVW